MPPIKQVTIRIEQADGSAPVQMVEAQCYEKNGALYYRYPEREGSMGDTTTTLKISPGELKIMRHGTVASEQIFIPGKPTLGYYHLAEGKVGLVVHTKHLESELNEGVGRIKWSYDLYMDDELTSTHALELDIREAAL